MSDEIRDSILTTIRKLLGTNTAAAASDAELLRRFVGGRDETAFELLVWRHAALVLGVCRQVLHEAEAIEDAFQATFVVLARKAGSISRGESLPAWLHRVAFRAALRARRQADRHRAGRQPGLDLEQVPAPPTSDLADEELRVLLHEEVLRLPARYRLPVVCCYLEGKTHEEAAAVLGWCKGTVAGRLARAREQLRRRLARRGVEMGLPALAVHLAADSAGWARRIGVLIQAVRALANESAPAGLSARAVALAEGVIQQMFWSKCKWAALLLTFTLAGLTAWGTGRAVGPGQASEKPADQAGDVRPKPAAPAKKPDDPFQEALARARVRKQLRMLGTAVVNYRDTYGTLPPPAIVDARGRPLLSWRVALLPFLEQDNLYRQFKLDEPWDSPHNRKLIARMPAVFAAVARTPRPHMTYFQYIVGPDAIFSSHRVEPLPGTPGAGMPGGPTYGPGPGPMSGSGPRGPMPGPGMPAGPRGPSGGPSGPPSGGRPSMAGPTLGSGAAIRDGTANTLLVVEAGSPVVWTKPDDVPYDPKKPVPRLGGQFASVIHVITADGTPRVLPRRLDERTLRAAITPAGDEPLDLAKLSQSAAPAGRLAHGSPVREALVGRLRQRNARLKEEAAVLKDTLDELKSELDDLRWALEAEKLLAQDPAAAALKKENAELEKSLRETRDDARKMLTEINRLKQELRRRQRK
jgi:RNA polymerase sigma factor (sigma-70 family)